MTREELQLLKTKQLKDIYFGIYNMKPRSSVKRDEIISAILNRYRIISRAKAFRVE